MRKLRSMLSVLGLGFLVWSTAAQAIPDWSFALLPSDGAISGSPGSTVGWGYTIVNLDSTNWLSLTGISADIFLNGTPDASVFDFPVLSPSSTLSVPYDGISGFFQLTWDPTAAIGFVNSGTFVVSADWYDGDPFASGQFLEFALDQSAPYSATVTGIPRSVPEPASLVLLGIGLAGLAAARRRKKA